MAKFLPILGALRGSIADVTFSRNAGGQYAKQKAAPTNGNTERQQAVRGFLASLSSSWAGLTSAQKSQWQGWADTHPQTDSLGQEYILTGHQAFVSLNSRLLDKGDAFSATPPGAGVPDPMTGVAITYTDDNTLAIVFTNTVGGNDCVMVWACLPQVGAGDPNFAQARLAGYSADAAATPLAMDLPWDVPTDYTSNFWVLVMDEYGQLSEPVKSTVQNS